MNTADHFLYFYTPCLSLRDIRLALQYVASYGGREGFFVLLKTNRRTFDDFNAVEKALRDYYGFTKEVKKNGEKESPQVQVKKALFRESTLKGLDTNQKKAVTLVEKVFKGRYLPR